MGGSVLQVLEGPEETLDACVARVERDPRHAGLQTVHRAPITRRDFPDWTMGFVPDDDFTKAQLETFRDLRDLANVPSGGASGVASLLIDRFLSMFRAVGPT